MQKEQIVQVICLSVSCGVIAWSAQVSAGIWHIIIGTFLAAGKAYHHFFSEIVTK